MTQHVSYLITTLCQKSQIMDETSVYNTFKSQVFLSIIQEHVLRYVNLFFQCYLAFSHMGSCNSERSLKFSWNPIKYLQVSSFQSLTLSYVWTRNMFPNWYLKLQEETGTSKLERRRKKSFPETRGKSCLRCQTLLAK